MSRTYRLRVNTEEQILVSADGDINAMAYHVRAMELSADEEYTAKLTETAGIGLADVKRTVSDLTADGEIVGLALRKKLKTERSSIAQEENEAELSLVPDLSVQRLDSADNPFISATEATDWAGDSPE
jgi:hypothetical protein